MRSSRSRAVPGGYERLFPPTVPEDVLGRLRIFAQVGDGRVQEENPVFRGQISRAQKSQGCAEQLGDSPLTRGSSEKHLNLLLEAPAQAQEAGKKWGVERRTASAHLRNGRAAASARAERRCRSSSPRKRAVRIGLQGPGDGIQEFVLRVLEG